MLWVAIAEDGLDMPRPSKYPILRFSSLAAAAPNELLIETRRYVVRSGKR